MFEKDKTYFRVPKILDGQAYEDRNGNIVFSCTFSRGYSLSTYLKAFEQIIRDYVIREEQSEDYQNGYYDGFNEGKREALADVKKAIEGSDTNDNR
jgi:hypothetical protein